MLFALTNVTLGYSSAHLTNMGAILWQGPHHDAVKSTTTSLETHRNKRESTLERSRRRRRVRAECRRFGVGRGEGGWAPSFSEHALVGAADARIELRLGLELSHHDTRKKRIGERTSRTSNVYVGNEWGGGWLTLTLTSRFHDSVIFWQTMHDLLLRNIARLLLPLFCCTGQATSPRLS